MDSELNLIEEYASLFMTIDEIAILLDFDREDFRREVRARKSLRAKAYFKGRLQTEIEMRRTTKQFAEKGSPQAEAQMIEFNRRQRIAE